VALTKLSMLALQYNSFVPPRHGINCQWFVDGRDYYAHVADALESAEVRWARGESLPCSSRLA